MEKQRQVKILSIVALVLAISAMTLGFAAFSTTLNISSSASVSPSSSDFTVKFSSNKDSLVTDEIVPSAYGENISYTNGIIKNSLSPTISNLSVTFGEPNAAVSYAVYVRNDGEYTAYLNNINYIGDKTCIAGEGTTESLAQSVCDDIYINVIMDNEIYTETTTVTGQSLNKDASKLVVIEIGYISDKYVDGPLTVNFPSISLVYSSVDDPSISGDVIRLVSGDINTPGSIVAIGNEQFYVIGKEYGNVILLSMYNLRVGNIIDENGNIISLTNQTGIQSSDIKGYVEGKSSAIGVVSYSDVDNFYTTSLVKTFVSNYETYLENMGVSIAKTRLISKGELESLGCVGLEFSCSGAPEWVYSSSYWGFSGSVSDDIWSVKSNKEFKPIPISDNSTFGVRPVIEISESEF